ncbi:hypothetical protein BB559_002039 [Furculomyces boomerangus]|uniref:Uncharacterized protein n=1 Tax=Furculomyces boomerangus TaxID=61424 RepID=A0A2T9YYJ9_9FUNG|nr:hypothetical protein BB559_002039 [Furculomyces boomerangus]
MILETKSEDYDLRDLGSFNERESINGNPVRRSSLSYAFSKQPKVPGRSMGRTEHFGVEGNDSPLNYVNIVFDRNKTGFFQKPSFPEIEKNKALPQVHLKKKHEIYGNIKTEESLQSHENQYKEKDVLNNPLIQQTKKNSKNSYDHNISKDTTNTTSSGDTFVEEDNRYRISRRIKEFKKEFMEKKYIKIKNMMNKQLMSVGLVYGLMFGIVTFSILNALKGDSLGILDMSKFNGKFILILNMPLLVSGLGTSCLLFWMFGGMKTMVIGTVVMLLSSVISMFAMTSEKGLGYKVMGQLIGAAMICSAAFYDVWGERSSGKQSRAQIMLLGIGCFSVLITSTTFYFMKDRTLGTGAKAIEVAVLCSGMFIYLLTSNYGKKTSFNDEESVPADGCLGDDNRENTPTNTENQTKKFDDLSEVSPSSSTTVGDFEKEKDCSEELKIILKNKSNRDEEKGVLILKGKKYRFGIYAFGLGSILYVVGIYTLASTLYIYTGEKNKLENVKIHTVGCIGGILGAILLLLGCFATRKRTFLISVFNTAIFNVGLTVAAKISRANDVSVFLLALSLSFSAAVFLSGLNGRIYESKPSIDPRLCVGLVLSLSAICMTCVLPSLWTVASFPHPFTTSVLFIASNAAAIIGSFLLIF